MLPHPSERYRLYIDETGIQSLKNTDGDPYLCLFGVIMKRRDHDDLVAPRLQQIKIDLFGHSDATPVIFHRRDIVRGDPPFDRLRSDQELSTEFQARWLALIGEIPYFAVAAAIDKREYLNRYKVWQYDAYHYCMMCILERYVKWLNHVGAVGDVIIESRSKKPDKRLKASYSRFYNSGSTRCSTQLVQSRLTTRDIKFSEKSADVAGIQIADSLAHPTLCYMRAVKTKAAIPATFGQSLVSILIKRKFLINPYDSSIEGWGIKMLP